MKEDKPNKNNLAQQKFQRGRKFEAIAQYGGRCSCCHEDEVEFLTIAAEKQKTKRPATTQIYNWLRSKKWPKGFRVLCKNCESAIAQYKKCPHELAPDADPGALGILMERDIQKVKERYRTQQVNASGRSKPPASSAE